MIANIATKKNKPWVLLSSLNGQFYEKGIKISFHRISKEV